MYEGTPKERQPPKVVLFEKDIVAKQFSEKIIVEKTLRRSSAKNKTETKVRMVPERRG